MIAQTRTETVVTNATAHCRASSATYSDSNEGGFQLAMPTRTKALVGHLILTTMKLRNLSLWSLLLLPIFLLVGGLLIANVYYHNYLDHLSQSWNRYPRVPLGSTKPNEIEAALKKQIDPSVLSPAELTGLAKAMGNWLNTQRDGSLESFQSFRMEGIKSGEIIISRDLCAYYQQFLEDDQQPSPPAPDLKSEDLIKSLFRAQQNGKELVFNGKRLCLKCIESISIDSIRASVVAGEINPLNTFMNGDDHFSMESFTGVFEPVGPFRLLLDGLTERSKTANVTFVVSSGDGNRQAYLCGLQYIWLPERELWFPIELMVGWPGTRMPMEAFLL